MPQAEQISMTLDDVEILQRETVYQGHFRLDKYLLRHRLFSGEWSQPLQREVFERGNAAGALLFDPDLKKIVLIEQFRVGVRQQGVSPWLLELVAGIMQTNETPAEVVIRETEEEAGLKVSELIPICDYWVSPGGTTEKVSLYCARVDASQAGGVYGLVEEGEDIRVQVLELPAAYQALVSGRISNAATIIALQWLQLNEQRVIAQWLTRN